MNLLHKLNAYAVAVFVCTGVGNSSHYVFASPFTRLLVKANTDGLSTGGENVSDDSDAPDTDVNRPR